MGEMAKVMLAVWMEGSLALFCPAREDLLDFQMLLNVPVAAGDTSVYFPFSYLLGEEISTSCPVGLCHHCLCFSHLQTGSLPCGLLSTTSEDHSETSANCNMQLPAYISTFQTQTMECRWHTGCANFQFISRCNSGLSF